MKCIEQEEGEGWTLYNGDSCQVIKGLPENTIGLSVFSPPFSNLYIYSDSEADMGNCANDDEFFAHFKYLIGEIHRITIPGRLCVVHCKDLPLYRGRDEASGLNDFPGYCIRSFEEFGWTYHSRVTIWKCPVIERERTNNNGLLHKTVKRDSSQIRQGMADYVIAFRKRPAGDDNLSSEPIVRNNGFTEFIGDPELDPRKTDYHPSPFARTGKAGDDSIDIWRRYAEPVWWDINQTNVLNYELGREDKDEKHICPLQLDLIERCIQLWSNPGDIVFTPFLGIGSEAYCAVKMGRRAIGIELKPSYFQQAVRNVRKAECEVGESMLFE